MSDLSRLLEDVYSSSAAPPQEARDETPAWSSEEALEQVFAEWVPGPPDEAPAQERAMFADSDETPTTAEEPVDWEAAIAAIAPQAVEEDEEPETETVPLLDDEDDSPSMSYGAFELFESIIGDMPRHDPEPSDTDAFIAALESMPDEEEVAVPAMAVAAAPSLSPSSSGWCRDDDDILPTRSARRFRLTLRR